MYVRSEKCFHLGEVVMKYYDRGGANKKVCKLLLMALNLVYSTVLCTLEESITQSVLP